MSAHLAWRIEIEGVYLVTAILERFDQIDQNGVAISATSGTAFATNFTQGNNPENAFNQIENTGWQSTGRNQPLVLGKIYNIPVDIRSVTMACGWFRFASQASPRYWKIQFSDDTTTGLDGSWATVYVGDNQRIPGTNYDSQPLRGPINYTWPQSYQGDLSVIEPYADTFAKSSTSRKHQAWRFVFTLPFNYSLSFESLAQYDENGLKVSIDNEYGSETPFAPYGTSFSNNIWDYAGTVPSDAFDESDNTAWSPEPKEYGLGIIGKIYDIDREIKSYSIGVDSFFASNFLNIVKVAFEYSDNTTTGLDGTWREVRVDYDVGDWDQSNIRSFDIPITLVYGSLDASETETDIAYFKRKSDFNGDMVAQEHDTDYMFDVVPFGNRKAWRLDVFNSNGAGAIRIANASFFKDNTAINIAKDLDFGSNFDNSNIGAGFTADQAFDENPITYWESTPGNSKTIGKLFYDPSGIGKLSITIPTVVGSEAYAPLEFQLQFSTDTTNGINGTWYSSYNALETNWNLGETREFPIQPIPEIIGDISLSEGNDILETITLGNPHKAFRLKITDVGPINGNIKLAISELQLFEFDSDFNIGLPFIPGTTFRYSEPSPSPINADNLFDGSSNTYQTFNQFTSAPYYIGKIFTGQFYAVERYDLQITGFDPNLAYPKDWVLEVSDNTTNGIDGTWHVYHSQNNQINWSLREIKHFAMITTEGDMNASEANADRFFTFPFTPLENETIFEKIITCTFSAPLLGELIIPISQLSSSITISGLSSATVTIPNGGKYSSNVSAYSTNGGTFRIDYMDKINNGELSIVNTITFNINDVYSGKQDNSWGISVYGTTKLPPSSFNKKIILNHAHSLTRDYQGKAFVIAALDNRIYPDDIVYVYDFELSVDSIKVTADNKNMLMELITREV